MPRPLSFITALLLALASHSSASAASPVADTSSPRILVLPLRSIGVNDTTTLVSGDLLEGSLGDLGMNVVRKDASQPPLPAGAGVRAGFLFPTGNGFGGVDRLDFPDYTYESGVQQNETAPTLDLVAGLMALRTYDFVAVVEQRYHHVFASFDNVGGGGAQGLMLTFGTSR